MLIADCLIKFNGCVSGGVLGDGRLGFGMQDQSQKFQDIQTEDGAAILM